MNFIIEYLKEHKSYSYIFALTIALSAIIIALIVIFYKKSKSPNSKDVNSIEKNTSNSIDFTINHSKAKIENETLSTENLEFPNEHIEEKPKPVIDENNNQKDNEKFEIDSSPLLYDENKITNTVIEENQITNTVIEENQTEDIIIKYAGKWEIKQEDGRYFADLKASNGEIMLRTETYSSLSGTKSGIETLKKNIEMENYAINLDKNGNFVFKIFSTARRLLCIGEGYSTREQCEKAFASVKRFSKTAKIIVIE